MEKLDENWPRNYPVKDRSILEISIEFLTEIEKRQTENFRKAGEIMGDNIMAGGLIRLVGTGGHTYLPVLDMSTRAGGLVTLNPTLDVSTSTITGGIRSMYLERVPGYFRALLSYFNVKEGEVAIIFNNAGVNAGVIDSALECKERGLTVIGVGSSIWQEDIPMDHYTRHPSKKNLMDIADLFIDDYNPVGDTVLENAGTPPLCPISTITDAYIVRRMELEAVKYMQSKGFTPEIWTSGNVEGGDDANTKYYEKYVHSRLIWLI